MKMEQASKCLSDKDMSTHVLTNEEVSKYMKEHHKAYNASQVERVMYTIDNPQGSPTGSTTDEPAPASTHICKPTTAGGHC